MKKLMTKKSFTIIEGMIVFTILMLLASVGADVVKASKKKEKAIETQEVADTFATRIE